jgi:hypothetical protein
MDSDNERGRFLRARRALVRPEDSEPPAGPRRRVAGPRREEVAVPAGVSTDYTRPSGSGTPWSAS